MEKNELLNIQAGAVSGTIINALVRGLTFALEIGRSLGTAIRRIKNKNLCII